MTKVENTAEPEGRNKNARRGMVNTLRKFKVARVVNLKLVFTD